MKLKKMMHVSILSGLSLIIYVLESQIPPIVPVAGVKLGLANAVTLYAKVTMGARSALLVLLMKIFLGNLFTGTAVSLFYSLCGGILCFMAEIIMFRLVNDIKQMWAVSITGAIFHNIGQVVAATVLMGTDKIMWYLTVLIPVGIITGAFTGLVATYTLRAMTNKR